MAPVQLTIRQPANGAVFDQAVGVLFEGQAVLSTELAGVPLFFRWYASLKQLAADSHGNVTQFSLNATAVNDAGTPLLARLPMGSHVITLAASDQADESALVNALHGGVAGGVNRLGVGHVIHVLKANIVSPTGTSPFQVTAATPFQAEAPWPFDDDSYKKVDGLRFTWLFEAKSGNQPDSNRPDLKVTDMSLMTFHKTPPVLQLNASTYSHLRGTYQVTLRVEAGTPPTTAQNSITVEFP